MPLVRRKGRDHLVSGARDHDAACDIDWRILFRALYDAVDKAEKVDTNAGDSAVSVVLWSYAPDREEANV